MASYLTSKLGSLRASNNSSVAIELLALPNRYARSCLFSSEV